MAKRSETGQNDTIPAENDGNTKGIDSRKAFLYLGVLAAKKALEINTI